MMTERVKTVVITDLPPEDGGVQGIDFLEGRTVAEFAKDTALNVGFVFVETGKLAVNSLRKAIK